MKPGQSLRQQQLLPVIQGPNGHALGIHQADLAAHGHRHLSHLSPWGEGKTIAFSLKYGKKWPAKPMRTWPQQGANAHWLGQQLLPMLFHFSHDDLPSLLRMLSSQ